MQLATDKTPAFHLGAVVRTIETRELCVVRAIYTDLRVAPEDGGPQEMYEVHGVDLYAVTLGNQTLAEAADASDKRFYAREDLLGPVPLFKLGRTSITPGALKAIGHEGAVILLRRHHGGDWGDLSDGDKRANEAALRDSDRILSAYQVTPDCRVMVITEHDRSYTTTLLASEY